MTQRIDTRDGVPTDMWDTDTGLYTRYVDGVPVETRPLTSDEIAMLTPPVDPWDAVVSAVQSAEGVDGLRYAVLDAIAVIRGEGTT